VALSRGDREAAVAIMAGRMGFYAVRAQQWRLKMRFTELPAVACSAAAEASLPLLRLHCHTRGSGMPRAGAPAVAAPPPQHVDETIT
jgi:hypothetical protein